MEHIKIFSIIVTILIVFMIELTRSQTCSYMWDPIFEVNSNNPPPMCPVTTSSGSLCTFPFAYNSANYTTCTIQGPNNPDFRPQCATTVDGNGIALTWDFCTVPTDAIVFYSTVRKNGPSTENSGSTQGGTMLWIYGNRFAQNGFSTVPSTLTSNNVQLTDGYSVYDCTMHTDKVTNTQLTCFTLAMPESLYQVRVYVNGYLIPIYQYYDKTQATFIPMPSQTPTITSIQPQTGSPQTLISLYGSFETSCYSRDVTGCSDDNDPLIIRIYIGGHLCNMINPVTNVAYMNITSTNLECSFEGNEVGVFNISMLVTNQYGRSLTSSNLYRVSATEQLYNFQNYAVISSVSPNSGSTQGGTILTINGQFFCSNAQYPLIVNVGGQTCTILNANLTTIQCQTAAAPTSIQSQYQGSRGLQLYHASGAISQTTLASNNSPSPSGSATQIWTDDATYVSTTSSDETVWLIGFVRVQKTATFTFILQTNGNGALFLSTNDNPANKVLIASASNSQSTPIVLQNNTNYYLFCVGSRTGGNLILSVQARMHETTLTAGTSSFVFNEIQRIDVNATITLEHQRLVYTTNSTGNGTSEVQTVQMSFSTFQLGFRGVYTALFNGQSAANDVQSALNDLPTIYPLSVTVTTIGSLFEITFPVEMGDVPLITYISTSTNTLNVTEVVQGVSSDSQIAFNIDGALTSYINFDNGTVTQTELISIINQIFSIQCPISLYNSKATPSIVYVEDFETNCVYDETSITSDAFCGQCSQTSNVLVNSNTQTGNYLCFAYKLLSKYTITLGLSVQINGDTTTTYYPSISLALITDTYWHYTCINVLNQLIAQQSIPSTSSSIVVKYASLSPDFFNDIMIDTITIRTSLPIGYEPQNLYPIDEPSSPYSCVFPFYYNGQQYSACTLDNNNMPICVDSQNQTHECQSSSIEGVRRLYPKHQLIYNTLNVSYSPSTQTIDISFRYSDCVIPALIVSSPVSSTTVTRISHASPAASGTFDLVYNGQTYPSIPVNIEANDLANLLQASPDFGFLNVTRLRDCTGYSYLIEWVANGGQKTAISITNTGTITPVGTTVTASIVQQGGVLYNPLPGDMTRTYYTLPQVEVIVTTDYPSLCLGTNTCNFQWLTSQTPTISSVTQSGMILTITGTDFSTTDSSNNVTIGTTGSCTVTAATTTSITCTISNGPSGSYAIGVNVDGMGLASASGTFTPNIPLQITSISPDEGGAGGGYTLTITGIGFSQNAIVTVDGNTCSNPQISDFSSITCIVPPTTALTNRQVIVSVIDGSSTANAPSQFTYNVTNTPTITSVSPNVVTMSGGQLTITGTLFGTSSIVVLIGTTSATIVSSSTTQIVATLPSLAPCLYPVFVSTTNGFARPSFQIEYQFYVQAISPQVGSLYGGTDVYVQGQGFDNSTTVNFTSNSTEIPCNVVSFQSSQIHCQTTSVAPQVNITSNGVDPVYGVGFAWSPQYATVQQGAIVNWQWGSSALLSSINYKVQQVANGYATQALSGGFDSSAASSSGSFSYQFFTIGTYYYWSTPVDSSGLISLRGVITVVPAQPQTLTVQVTSGSFTAQSCVFPFTFNGVSYTLCTTTNDTQLWCSPSTTYTGQRLYCTPTTSVPASSCGSSTVINPTSCSQTVPTSNPLEFLFTPCTVGSVSSISPTSGIAGTSITITGTGFGTVNCENDVLIGSSYSCPIISATSTQIICQIGAGSMLDAGTIQSIQVIRGLQGYLANNGLLQFQFNASISSISPIHGSFMGGTLVTINGDGFTSADIRLIVGSTDYTSLATITYSQITFITPALTIGTYPDQNIPVTILVGNNRAVCLPSACIFRWSTSVTPYINSVSPTSITGPTTLTLIGQNFQATGSVMAANIHVTINGHACNVTSMTNSSVSCSIGNVEAGNYSVAASIDGVGSVVSYAYLASTPVISNVSPTTIGTYGGALLTITGNGFSSNISSVSVTVGSSSCTVVSTSPNQIQCIAPAQGSSTSSAISITSNGIEFPSTLSVAYSSGITPVISSISPTSGTASQLLTITGSNFINGQTSVQVGGVACAVNTVSSTSITCTVGSSPAGYQPVIVEVILVGQSNPNFVFEYLLQVTSVTPSQGSYGGGQVLTVVGSGFSGSNVAVTICNQACQSVTILSNTQLRCITPVTTYSTSDITCSLTVTVGDFSQSQSFVYRTSLTAIVTSVSPTRGGTGGGTTLNIIGTNFPTSTSAASVSIAGINCIIQTISSTSITCLTGSYPGMIAVEATVIVTLTNNGNAISSAQFEYINLWSSPWTWGGEEPPEEGTIVVINDGQTIYFDTTTPILKALIIDNGSLIFDDNQDVQLNAEYILVDNGGLFQVGTESNPFQHQAIITMYGQLRSIELPIYGAKVLALREGTIDLHGQPINQIWTHLNATANSGSSQITLRQPVNWIVGNQIVIATTGDYLSQTESEVRTITSISSDGLTLTLDTPLNYTHLGITQTIGSTTIDLRAEVGLLSHNVLFQGSVTPTFNQVIPACPVGFNPDQFAVQNCFMGKFGEEIGSDQFGATIMASGSEPSSNDTQFVILRISNVEIRYVGQAFRLGRYPVHFHMNGNMSLSYIKSSSIHHTFNRAVNIHASNYVNVANNVIYDIMGGAVFLEDGVEIGNVMQGNLAIFVQPSSSLLNEDITPAAFWVTNPNNTVEHNAVAGNTHFGYWYRMLQTPDGPSFGMFPGFCPFRQPFGRFFNNSVHSTGQFGTWIFPDYAPTVGGSCWADAPYQAVFEGLTSWRNVKGMEFVVADSIQIKNAIVWDNSQAGLSCLISQNNDDSNLPNLRATFYNVSAGPSVINSIIIGDSGTSSSPLVPTLGGLIVMWDRGFIVQNVSLINFPSTQTQAISCPILPDTCTVNCGGWVTKFSQMSFTNVAHRGNFRWQYDGFYQDLDGTLNGVPGQTLFPPDGLWNASTLCTPTPNFLNGVSCPTSMGTWLRFAFNQDSLSVPGEMLYVYDSSNHVAVGQRRKEDLTHAEGFYMALLAKRTYTLVFQFTNTSVNLSYTGVVYNLAPGDYLILCHPIELIPDQVYTISSTSMATQSHTPLSPSNNNNGDWYYDNTTSHFCYIALNPSTNVATIDVVITLNVIKCRYPNCQPPIQPALELPATARPANALYWSNDSDWSFAGLDGKPDDNTNIYIPRGIWLVVDYPLPTILSLQIDGVLEFEQGMDNTMYVNSIFINGGQMIVGWPNNPLNSSVDIIITGSSAVNVDLPNNAGSMGPIVIGVFGGLDLHGLPQNITWTRIGATAASGQNTIVLSQPVDWNVGDEIIVTTTDINIQHTERHTIASITSNGMTITTVSSLAYTHIVLHEVFNNGQVVNIAGAVGLLTHNVRVISRNSASNLFGFRILITDYAINIWDPAASQYLYTYYKGYARISNTQFIGYGQYLMTADNDDLREGIHMDNLGDWNASRPSYVDSCSFDGGYFSAIGIWQTNGVPIKNNVIYNTYQSAIVVAGQNNIIQNNLVSTVYWSGSAQPQYAQFNLNFDAAIMSTNAISVVMTDNFVAGVDRLGYHIQGNACPGTVVPAGINNTYSNNEVHSAMSGVNIWSTDSGFQYDQECVLFSGFKTYKAWYYGMYIQTTRNIIIDSCTVVDGNVGIVGVIIGPSPLTHVADDNFVYVRNSVVAAAMTPNDCDDTVDTTTLNIMNVGGAAPNVASALPNGRSGIIFPYIFGNSMMMPGGSWTAINAYPCVDGHMNITNVTFAYFNNTCGRRDIAIQVAQHNDNGAFPIKASLMSLYNTASTNLIFNGRPNLEVININNCIDMDCDGLKKNLLIDLDGTLVGQPSSIFSQADYNWGNQRHGVGDFRIPLVAMTYLNGTLMDINNTDPYRGISRGPTCSYQPLWQMYLCTNKTDYRMLIIESMDSDTETRRLSPVAVFSDNGYIDLINGPSGHGWCNGYPCYKRISTFMALVEVQHHFDIYLTSTQPNHIRFRLIDCDASSVVSLALQYDSLQQIDVYANGIYVSPANRNLQFQNILMLLDEPDPLTLSSPAGSNFFNRTYQMANFIINGDTVIDLVISQLLVLNFGLPPLTPTSFYSTNFVANLATLLGVSPNMIRRVDIVSANGNSSRLVRRQTSSTTLRVELRDDPLPNLSSNSTNQTSQMQAIASMIINMYQSGELQTIWSTSNITGYTAPTSLSCQQPLNQTTQSFSMISQIELVIPPGLCREQSPCGIQPVIVAYDSDGNVIQSLGSNIQPWQIVATAIGQPNVNLLGAIANYSNGQSQYTIFGVPYVGTYQVQFAFIRPNGVSSSFVLNVNLTASTSAISVTEATLGAAQMNQFDVVPVNQTFNISGIIIDSVSGVQISDITWRNCTWSAAVSLYTLSQYNAQGQLITSASSIVTVDITTGIITVTDLAINNVGMYILNMVLSSSDCGYSLQFTSNGILVNNTVLQVNSGIPQTYITFAGDYNALSAAKQLDITTAIIYNYLLTIGMPIVSYPDVYAGSVVIAFLLSSNLSATATAVSAIQSNGNAVSGLSATSIVINGNSLSIRSSPAVTSSNSNSYPLASNAALTIGLVVGLVGGLIIVLGIIYSYRKYYKKHKHRRLVDDHNYDNSIDDVAINSSPMEANLILPLTAVTLTDGSQLTRRLSALAPVSTVISEDSETERVPSASISVTKLDLMGSNNGPHTNSSMPPVALIQFD